MSNNPPPSPRWDHAYFISGGESGVFSQADIGTPKDQVSGNAPNGADPSCVSGDVETMNTCVKGGAPYSEAFVAAQCKKNSCCIGLVNPPTGRVATFAQGEFGSQLMGASCSTGHYDRTLAGGSPDTKFAERRDQLVDILKNCGKDPTGYTKKQKNSDGTTSCLITTKAFRESSVKLPGEDSEMPVSNEGVAISWGTGVGDGGCGAMALLQQGNAPGHENPGNTILNFQVGSRAWKGKWSDTIEGRSGYLTDGLSNSQTCLQPRFRVLTDEEAGTLLKTLCLWNTKLCTYPPSTPSPPKPKPPTPPSPPTPGVRTTCDGIGWNCGRDTTCKGCRGSVMDFGKVRCCVTTSTLPPSTSAPATSGPKT